MDSLRERLHYAVTIVALHLEAFRTLMAISMDSMEEIKISVVFVAGSHPSPSLITMIGKFSRYLIIYQFSALASSS